MKFTKRKGSSIRLYFDGSSCFTDTQPFAAVTAASTVLTIGVDAFNDASTRNDVTHMCAMQS